MQQTYDYYLIYILSFNIAVNIAFLGFSGMKMLGAFPVGGFGELAG